MARAICLLLLLLGTSSGTRVPIHQARKSFEESHFQTPTEKPASASAFEGDIILSDQKEDIHKVTAEIKTEAAIDQENNQNDDDDVVNYTGWSVLKIEGLSNLKYNARSGNEDQINEQGFYPLEELEERSDVRVLQEHKLEDFYHIAVAPGSNKELVKNLESKGLQVSDLQVDLGEIIDESSASFRKQLPKGEVTFDHYMNLQQIEDFIFEFAAQHPQTVTRSVIGKSVEGRDIHMLTLSMGGRNNRQLPPPGALRPSYATQTVSVLSDLIRWSENSEDNRKAGALRQQMKFKKQAAHIEEQLRDKAEKTPTEEVFETVMLNMPFDLDKLDKKSSIHKTFATLQEIINHDKGNKKPYVVLDTDDQARPIQHTFKVLENIINKDQPTRHRRPRKDTSILGVLKRISKAVKTGQQNSTASNTTSIDSATYADILFLLHSIIPSAYVDNATVVESVKRSILIISKQLPEDGELTEQKLSELAPDIVAIPGVVGVTSTTPETNRENIMKLARLLNTLNITDFAVNTTKTKETSQMEDDMARRSNKPVIFVDGGIHAREWVSPAFLMYLLTELVNDTPLLLGAEWRIVPVLNPDGYRFTWTGDRMWRKNRAQSSSCRGVDLNRNFGHEFGGAGTSTNKCSEVYRGPHAFSEPESRALKSAIEDVKHRLEAYVSVHSYGQMILHPWGYTASKTHPNDKNLKTMGDGMAKAIKAVNGKKYLVGAAARVLYSASGGSDDWVSTVGGSIYSYTMELRDKGSRGFILPANQIKPTVIETWAAIKYLGENVIGQKARSSLPPKALTLDQVDPSNLFSSIGITSPIDGDDFNAYPLNTLATLMSEIKPDPAQPTFYSAGSIQPHHGHPQIYNQGFYMPQQPYQVQPNYQFAGPLLQLPFASNLQNFQYNQPQQPGDNNKYSPNSQIQNSPVPYFFDNAQLGIQYNPASPTTGIQNDQANLHPSFSTGGSNYADGVRAHFKSPFYMSAQSPNYVALHPNSGFPYFPPSVQYSAHNSFIPYSSPMIVKPSPYTNDQETSELSITDELFKSEDAFPVLPSHSQSASHLARFQPLYKDQTVTHGDQIYATRPSSWNDQSPVLVSMGNLFSNEPPALRSPILEPVGQLVPIEYRRIR